METFKPLFNNSFGITSTIVVQWVVIALLAVIAYLSTRNLKKIPDKRQSVVEMVIDSINKLVKENMGESYKSFVPYIGTLVIYMLILNLSGLVGVAVPTEDINVTAGLAAITFFIIQATSIKRNGVKEYLLGYGRPIPIILPINIMERVATPISLCLRLFGNMTAGGVIIGMIYGAMGHFAFGAPILAHAYFDVFDGSIQMVIFVMLTMINIKTIAEE